MILDAIREERTGVVAALFANGARAGIHVAVTDDLVARGIKAGPIVNELAAVSGGRGGGKPHFASAGAGDATLLEAAMEQAPTIVAKVVSGV